MLSIERRNLILNRLQTDQRVLVSALSAEFDVSDETIRRDLERLESEGYASRTYGGATLCENLRNEQPYNIRKMTNAEAKQRIAAKIADLIQDGDFIMLDESSTAAFVARAIRRKKNITVITNSIEIIHDLADVDGWNIMGTGGKLKSGVLAFTGHQTETFIRSYHVDKAIISSTGLDLERGYTDAGEENALVKRAMLQSANETILAVDAGKFGKKAFASIGTLAELSAIVTDKEPDDIWKIKAEEEGVDLLW